MVNNLQWNSDVKLKLFPENVRKTATFSTFYLRCIFKAIFDTYLWKQALPYVAPKKPGIPYHIAQKLKTNNIHKVLFVKESHAENKKNRLFSQIYFPHATKKRKLNITFSFNISEELPLVYPKSDFPTISGADPGFWNGGWIFSTSIREIKYHFNIWGITKKKRKGAQKKGGENSPISPPLDPRLDIEKTLW